MKHLTLIRHAKSDWYTGETDFDRPLNARGRKAAPLLGGRLAIRGACPELVLCSPALRARQTAEQILSAIGYPLEQVVFHPEIYEASLNTLIGLLEGVGNEVNDLLMIGHNPGFSLLGQWLNRRAPEWLPTCGVLSLELDLDSWRDCYEDCAVDLSFDYPKNPQ